MRHPASKNDFCTTFFKISMVVAKTQAIYSARAMTAFE